MSELKPCPFCGGTAIRDPKVKGDTLIICSKCNAFGPDNDLTESENREASSEELDRLAAEKWNTRV